MMTRRARRWEILGILIVMTCWCGGVCLTWGNCNAPDGTGYGLIVDESSVEASETLPDTGLPVAGISGLWKDDMGLGYSGELIFTPESGPCDVGMNPFYGYGEHTAEDGSWCYVDTVDFYVVGQYPPTTPGDDGETPDDGTSDDEDETGTTDPVDTRNGNCYFTEDDFSIPCPGIPLAFSRRYNSVQDSSGVLGRGWRHTYEWQVKAYSQLIPAQVQYEMPLPRTASQESGPYAAMAQPPLVSLPRYGNGSSVLIEDGMSIRVPNESAMDLPQGTKVRLASGQAIDLDGQVSLRFQSGESAELKVASGGEGKLSFQPTGTPELRYRDGTTAVNASLSGATLEFGRKSGTLPKGTEITLRDGSKMKIDDGGTFRPSYDNMLQIDKDGVTNPDDGLRYWGTWMGPDVVGSDPDPGGPYYDEFWLACGDRGGGAGGGTGGGVRSIPVGTSFIRKTNAPYAMGIFTNGGATFIIDDGGGRYEVKFPEVEINATNGFGGNRRWSLSETNGEVMGVMAANYLVKDVSYMVIPTEMPDDNGGIIVVPQNGTVPPILQHTYEFTRSGTLVAASVGGRFLDLATIRTIISYITNSWVTVCTGDGDEVRFRRGADGALVTPPGNTWTLVETPAGYDLKFDEGHQYHFGAQGQLASISDAWNNRVTLAYTNDADYGALLARVEHSNGQGLDLAYQAGRLTSVTVSSNLSVSFAYDQWGQLTNATRHTSQDNAVASYAYTGEYLSRRVLATGYACDYTYERRPFADDPDTNHFEYTSRCVGLAVATNYYKHTLSYSDTNTTVTYERGDTNQVYVYSYPNGNTLHEVIGPNGLGRTTYSYDSHRNITRTKVTAEDTSEFIESRTQYDSHDLPVRMSVGYRSSATQTVAGLSWDAAYRVPTLFTNPAGYRMELGYDKGLPIVIREWADAAQSNETHLGYTTNGLLSSITNANGHHVAFDYDAHGFLTRLTPEVGPAVDYVFTPLGYLQKITLPGGRTNLLDPDELGRVRTVTYPDGSQAHYAYDAAGVVTNVVDAMGRVTRVRYAPVHKLTEIAQVLEGDPSQEVRTTFDYDYQFNALRIKDALDRDVEAYQRDLQDRPTCITNIEGQTMSIDWGVGGVAHAITRFDGTTVSNSYDEMGRVTQVAYPDEVVGVSYFADGQPKALSNSLGVVALEYDGARRLTNAAGIGPNAALSMTYYPAGQVSNVTSVAGVVSYLNDAAERLQYLDAPQGRFGFTYDGSNGLAESVSYPGGMQAHYAYDVMDRVTSMEWADANSNVIRRLEYGYDAAGMITNVARETGESTAYSYDSLYRLTGESCFDAGGDRVHESEWRYDLVGNRLMQVEDGVTNVGTLGQGNRLATFGAAGSVLQDAAGCVTALVFDASRRLDLDWNSQYQLTGVRVNGEVAEQYSYDAVGRRVMTVAGGVTNWHVYDGAQVVADLDASGGVLRTYVWGPGIDNLMAIAVYAEATNTYYAVKDHLGSVLAMTDTNGVIVEAYRYDAWGRVQGVYDSDGQPLNVSAIGNRYLWQGREYSLATGLYNFRARWYDPITGRWLSNDPIGISGGLNQYVFCENNPVNYTDPEGTTSPAVALPWLEGGSVAGAGALAGAGAGLAAAVTLVGSYDLGEWIGEATGLHDALGNAIGDAITALDSLMKPHRKGAMESTRNRHEEGEATRKQNQHGGEKGDANRQPRTRQRDPNNKGRFLPFPGVIPPLPDTPPSDGDDGGCQ